MKTKTGFDKRIQFSAMLCLAFTCLILLAACNDDDDDDHPFSIRVNMEMRVMVVGASDPDILVGNAEVNLEAYRRTYNSALFKWENDDRIEINRVTLSSSYRDAGYTPYWRFDHYLYWRAPNHHDEIVMRAKLASQDNNAWVEMKFTYEDAKEYDDDEVTIQRTLMVRHPDY